MSRHEVLLRRERLSPPVNAQKDFMLRHGCKVPSEGKVALMNVRPLKGIAFPSMLFGTFVLVPVDTATTR